MMNKKDRLYRAYEKAPKVWARKLRVAKIKNYFGRATAACDPYDHFYFGAEEESNE